MTRTGFASTISKLVTAEKLKFNLVL